MSSSSSQVERKATVSSTPSYITITLPLSSPMAHTPFTHIVLSQCLSGLRIFFFCGWSLGEDGSSADEADIDFFSAIDGESMVK